MKFKLTVSILAVSLSTTVFAADDNLAPISNGDAFSTPIVVAALSPNAGNASSPTQNGDVKTSSGAGQKASSSDTCMGSSSTGVQLPVIGGISFGSSWTDKNCMMIKNARELWNMGFKTAALARMCMDDRNREALESTGTPCPPTRRSDSSRQTDSPTLTYLQ